MNPLRRIVQRSRITPQGAAPKWQASTPPLTHARRKLHEAAQSGTAPIAEEGQKQIATL